MGEMAKDKTLHIFHSSLCKRIFRSEYTFPWLKKREFDKIWLTYCYNNGKTFVQIHYNWFLLSATSLTVSQLFLSLDFCSSADPFS